MCRWPLCQDPAKREFADELIAYADAFTKALYAPLISRVDMSDEAGKNSWLAIPSVFYLLSILRLVEIKLYQV
jgi:hypothetical protein